jgi:hypothetical protein
MGSLVTWKLQRAEFNNLERYNPGTPDLRLPEGAVPVRLDVDEERSTLYFLVPKA